MKKRVILLILVVVYSTPIFCSEKLTVLTEDWPPFNYQEGNTIIGISTELVTETLKRAEIDYDLKIRSWKRAYKETEGNVNTILFTTSRTNQREKLFKWVGPLYPRQINLYRLKFSGRMGKIIINELKDLKKFRLGILGGGSVEEYLKSKGFMKHKHYDWSPTEKQNILKLFSKRVDLIPGSDMGMAFRMKKTKYKFSDLEKAFILIDQGGYYVAINKNTSDSIVEKIEKSFHSLIKEGLRKKITMKYLGY